MGRRLDPVHEAGLKPCPVDVRQRSSLANDKPIDPADGPRLKWSITTGGRWPALHGDGELLYAGTHGPIGSIRLANIRDGLQDYEYLWLLSQRAGGIEAARAACLPVTTSLTEFTRDPAALAAQRHAIARKLEMP